MSSRIRLGGMGALGRWLFALTFLWIGAAAPSAMAQSGSAPTKRAELELRLMKWRAEVLRKEVGLDEKKATEVEHTLDRFRTERENLQKLRHEQQKTLRALLDLDSNDQAAYGKAMAAVRDNIQKQQALRLQEFDELMKQLTPKQQAKLARVIRQMEQKVKAFVEKRAREGDDD